MNSIEVLLKSITVPGESKTLTKEEEVKLGSIIQNPSSSEEEKRKAVDTLVVKNVYLVLKLVHKYKRVSFDLEDLVGYGILGLFTAARKYDSSQSNRFASYARHWIKESVMKAVREYSGTPKIPVYLVKDLWNVSRILTTNGDISDEELSERASLDILVVKHLRSLLFTTIQFDPEYTEVDYNTPEQEYILKERDSILHQVLSDVLNEDELIVLTHFCELGGCKKMTFADIEDQFNIKNARKIKASAMSKLSKDIRLSTLYKEC